MVSTSSSPHQQLHQVQEGGGQPGASGQSYEPRSNWTVSLHLGERRGGRGNHFIKSKKVQEDKVTSPGSNRTVSLHHRGEEGRREQTHSSRKQKSHFPTDKEEKNKGESSTSSFPTLERSTTSTGVTTATTRAVFQTCKEFTVNNVWRTTKSTRESGCKRTSYEPGPVLTVSLHRGEEEESSKQTADHFSDREELQQGVQRRRKWLLQQGVKKKCFKPKRRTTNFSQISEKLGASYRTFVAKRWTILPAKIRARKAWTRSRLSPLWLSSTRRATGATRGRTESTVTVRSELPHFAAKKVDILPAKEWANQREFAALCRPETTRGWSPQSGWEKAKSEPGKVAHFCRPEEESGSQRERGELEQDLDRVRCGCLHLQQEEQHS